MAEIEVLQLVPADSECLEEWIRVTDEKDLFGVCVTRFRQGDWPWRVSIHAAEFIRDDPLQSQVFDAITSALNAAPGASRAVQEDREVWLVQGSLTGEVLVRSCAAVLDRLAEPMRSAYTSR